MLGGVQVEVVMFMQCECFEVLVKVVVDQCLVVDMLQGCVELFVYVDYLFDQVVFDVMCVFIVIYGMFCNVDVYYVLGCKVVEKVGVVGVGMMVVVLQFLICVDVCVFLLFVLMFVWMQEGWKGGELVCELGLVSLFVVFDVLFVYFVDCGLYLLLLMVVVIGYFVGVQLLQCYVVVGCEGDVLVCVGIVVCYVVVNLLSYLYFDDEWLNVDVFVGGVCLCVIEWKYGLKLVLFYVVLQDVCDFEMCYVVCYVVYLFGQVDMNLIMYFIDCLCVVMVQGLYWLVCGFVYFDYLKKWYLDDFVQQVVEVLGVGYDGVGMFMFVCGLVVLFGYVLF